MTEVENAVGGLIQCYKNTAHLLRNPRIFEETEERIADEQSKATEESLARSTYKFTMRDNFTVLWVLFTKRDFWLHLLEFVYFMIVRVPTGVYSGNFSLILLERRVSRNVNRIVAVCNLYHSMEKDTTKKDAVSKVIDELTKVKGERNREKEESTSSRVQNLLGSLSAAATVVTLIFGEQISNYLSQVFPNTPFTIIYVILYILTTPFAIFILNPIIQYIRISKFCMLRKRERDVNKSLAPIRDSIIDNIRTQKQNFNVK